LSSTISPIILLLVLVIFMLLGFFLMKRTGKKIKKAKSEPPKEGGICEKCGTQIEPGSKFCPQCGNVVG